MRYLSTKGTKGSKSFQDIILGGMAPDGGLDRVGNQTPWPHGFAWHRPSWKISGKPNSRKSEILGLASGANFP